MVRVCLPRRTLVHMDEKLRAQNILSYILSQLENRILQKKVWNARKKSPIPTCRRLYRRLGYMLVGMKDFGHPSGRRTRFSLGVDEFGRDVGDLLHVYVNLLARRGVGFHTLLVLGSRAKGRWSPNSDVDVLLILKKPSQKLNKKALSGVPLFVDIYVECYSEEEIKKMMNTFCLTFLDAFYWGKTVYDDGFWFSITNEFSKLEKKYRLPGSLLKSRMHPI